MNKKIFNNLKDCYGMAFECNRNLLISNLMAKDKKIIIIDEKSEYNKKVII